MLASAFSACEPGLPAKTQVERWPFLSEKKRNLIQTRRERLKSALYFRLKKREVFKICSGRFFEKLTKKFRRTQKGVIRTRKTLQNFQYSVLRQIPALFLNLLLLLSETQFTPDITSKIRIVLKTSRDRPKSAPYLRLKNSKSSSKYQSTLFYGT